MKITFIDGVPGVGVTRWLTEADVFTSNATGKGRLILPEFADIAQRNKSLRPADMSESLIEITHSLVTKIEEAEKEGRDLILGWSPVSYYVFALLKRKRLSTESILLYEDVMRWVKDSSETFLLKRPIGVTPNEHRLLLMQPAEVQRFGTELETEYRRLMKDSVNVISKIGDGIWMAA
jgi:hypothetical protein